MELVISRCSLRNTTKPIVFNLKSIDLRKHLPNHGIHSSDNNIWIPILYHMEKKCLNTSKKEQLHIVLSKSWSCPDFGKIKTDSENYFRGDNNIIEEKPLETY